MKIAYISNLKLAESSGGWSGINLNLYQQLKKYFTIEYLGPINPDFVFREKLLSKLYRKLGLKSDFAFFSEKRLSIINDEFSNSDKSEVDAYFFFGNTPWIKIQPNKPYYVYMDADFITYLKVFSDYSKFSKKAIQRIATQEKTWLYNAEAIFFGSNWIMGETMKNLGLTEDPKKHYVVNTGGHIPIPKKDTYNYKEDELKLLFIALNFEKKGGFDAVNIFLECKKILPKATLTIIGEEPPSSVLQLEGINYLGRLSKNKEDELKIMMQAFQKASFLIHPTKMDTMGAIIPEANYFGTPAVASNRFGVPDLIKDGETGFLIQNKEELNNVCDRIIRLFKDKEGYFTMRSASRLFSLNNFSWDSIGRKLKSNIQ